MQSIDYDGFSAWLFRNNRRKTTINKHLNCLKFLERHKHAINYPYLEKFLTGLKEKNFSHSYINNFVCCLRLYGQFKGIEELLKLRQYPKKYRAKATFSDEEIESFLSLGRRKNQPHFYFPKYKVFWHLVAFTGARPGEIAKLQKKHIDWGRGVLVFEETKTNVPGVVPIPPNCKILLKEYIDGLTTDWLFPSAKGGAHYSAGDLPVIDNVDWHYDFKKRLAQMGGINRPNLTPYSFRHSMATRLLEENVSLFHVKKLMRHSQLKTTEVYSHLTTKDIIEAVQHHPLIRKGSDPRFILRAICDTLRGFNLDKDNRFQYSLNESDGEIEFSAKVKP